MNNNQHKKDRMKLRLMSIFALVLISCGEEIAPVNETSPVGEWMRQDKFIENGFVDSSTVKYSLHIGSDSHAIWKMHVNDSLKKAVQGAWVLEHDTLTVRDYTCSNSESLTPTECSTLPILGNLQYRWDGVKILDLHLSGYAYTRIK